MLLVVDPIPSSSPQDLSSASSVAPNESTSSTLTSPETTKFLYSSLHRVDNLLRQYHNLRTESYSNVNRMAQLSLRLSLLANSSLAASIQAIDYEHILSPLPKLSFADRMAISLKEQLDREIRVVDATLSEMELVYMGMDDVLCALSNLLNAFQHDELLKAANHVERVYVGLVKEVRGIVLSLPYPLYLFAARRELWYRFTADEKRKSFVAASTLGDLLVSPPVEWEAFAQAWIAIGETEEKKMDEVDELAMALGNWGNMEDSPSGMME